MLYRVTPNNKTTYQGDRESVYDFVGSLSPDNMPLIDALTDAATVITEKYIGQPLGTRQIRMVLARGESELNDAYQKSWLQSGANFGGGMTGTLNQWIEFPCDVQSVQSVMIGSWQTGTEMYLTAGQDYEVDLLTYKPRIMFSYNLFIQDFFYKYKNLVIDFTGGLSEVDGTIPQPIDIAIKYMTKNMFENRGDTSTNPIDNGFKYLVSNYVNPHIAGGS